MVKTKYPLWAHQDGKRVAKRLFVPLSVSNAENAKEWLNSKGWTSPQNVCHLSQDRRMAHPGNASDCLLCKTSIVTSSAIKTEGQVIDPKVKIDEKKNRNVEQSENPQPQPDTASNIGYAYMLDVATPLLCAKVKQPHATIYFNHTGEKQTEFLASKESFTVKLGAVIFLAAESHPGIVVKFKPSNKMLEWRAKLKISHDHEDFLPHITLQYGDHLDVKDYKNLNLPKTVVLKNPRVSKVVPR